MKTFQQFLENQVDLTALNTVINQISNFVDVNKIPEMYNLPQGKETIDQIIKQVVGDDEDMVDKILTSLGVGVSDEPRTQSGDIFQPTSRRLGL